MIHVRARQFDDAKTVTFDFQLTLRVCFMFPVESDDLLPFHHVELGFRGIEQQLLLRRLQGRLPAFTVALAESTLPSVRNPGNTGCVTVSPTSRAVRVLDCGKKD
jgi:hypothetical protein